MIQLLSWFVCHIYQKSKDHKYYFPDECRPLCALKTVAYVSVPVLYGHNWRVLEHSLTITHATTTESSSPTKPVILLPTETSNMQLTCCSARAMFILAYNSPSYSIPATNNGVRVEPQLIH